GWRRFLRNRRTLLGREPSTPLTPPRCPPGRGTFTFLCVLLLAYFFLFVRANLVGSGDCNMLAPVSIDEYVNYRLVISMTSGGSPRELLSNLFFFDGDVDLLAYGYPFWSTSALAILPVNVLLKAGLIEECHRTTADILILRQLNPLLLSLTIVLLIY